MTKKIIEYRSWEIDEADSEIHLISKEGDVVASIDVSVLFDAHVEAVNRNPKAKVFYKEMWV